MKSFETTVSNYSGTFPNTQAVNATGAGAVNGTEWIAALINEWWGFHQALMNEAMLTPNGVQEAPGASQLVDSIRIVSGNAGEFAGWWGPEDPAVSGLRILLLAGQVITIANYPDLVAAVYCGDSLNATAPAFYKTSDAGGTTRSTSGAYFVLGDARGVTLRGYDAGATRDPDGATRLVGSVQTDGLKTHTHSGTTGNDSPDHTHLLAPSANGNTRLLSQFDNDQVGPDYGSTNTAYNATNTQGASNNHQHPFTTDTGSGTITETRMVNISCQMGIRY